MFSICFGLSSRDSVILREVKSDVVTLTKEDKLLFIRGKDLKLDKLLDNEIIITGLILTIEL